MPLIVRVTEAGRTVAHRFSDTVDRIVIGRGEDADVRIDEGRASRAHCQIQRAGRGWKLVDLESRNGTKVDGLMVNAHAITGAETINVGDAVIKVEGVGSAPAQATPVAAAPAKPAVPVAPAVPVKPAVPAAPVAAPAPAKPAKPAAPAAPPAAPSPIPVSGPAAAPPPIMAAGGTIQMTRPPSGRHQPRPKKGLSGLATLGVAAAVLLGLVVIGMEFMSYLEAQAVVAQDWKDARSAHQAAQSAAPGAITAALENAHAKYARYASVHAGKAHAREASKRAADLTLEIRRVKKWESVLADIETQRKVLDSTVNQLTIWHDRLAALGEDAPHPGLAAEVRMAREEFKAALDRESSGRVAEVQQLAKADLDNGEFAGALRRLQKLRSGSGVTADAKAALEQQIAALAAKADAVFEQEVMTKVEALIANKEYDAADRALREGVDRFRGFEGIELKASIKRKVVALVRQGGMTTAEADTYDKREDLYAAAVEAEKAARERKFGEAISSYEKIVASADLRDVKEEFQRKIEDVRLQQALWKRFQAEAAAGKFADRTWKLPKRAGGHLDAAITGADDTEVTFQVSGAVIRKRWNRLSSEELLSLLRVPTLSVEDEFAWSLFAHALGEQEAAEASLVALTGRHPDRGRDIQLLVSRMRKEPMPEGGYLVYAGKFVTSDEKRTAVAAAELKDVLDRIRSAKPDELASAVAALGGRSDAKPLAISVLNERHATMAAELDKYLGPIGKRDKQLEALRDELDKRRLHALTLIWDIEKYPDKKKSDPDFYRRADDEVHARIKTVTEMWENPYKSSAVIHPKAAQVQADLIAVEQMIGQLGGTVKAGKPHHDPMYLARFRGQRLTIQTYARNVKEERAIAYSYRVMEINDDVDSDAQQTELKQIKITNEYRLMMGFGPKGSPSRPDTSSFDQLMVAVLYHDQLWQSAKWHSEFMAETGQFGHVLPGHRHGDGPFDRMKKAGYSGGGSENIHMGHGDPRGAHLSWLHSANHHRNILTPRWRSLGSGKVGKYWTQNFGSAPPADAKEKITGTGGAAAGKGRRPARKRGMAHQRR